MNSSTLPSKKKLVRVTRVVVIFCLSFLLLDRILADLLIPFCLRSGPSSGKSFINDDILNAEILIIGSSRTYRAFDPEIMARQTGMTVRHEATKGKYPKYHYHFYQQYRQISQAPKILIWGLDYFLFAHGTDLLFLQNLGIQEAPPTPEPRQAQPNNQPVSLLSRISHLVHKRSLIQATLYDILNTYKPEDHPSGPKKYRNTTRHIQAEVEPAKYKKFPYHPYPGQEGRYLEAFFKLLLQDGVQIYLVFLPDYLGTQLSHEEEGTYIQEWTEIAARHPGITLLNFNTEKTFDLKSSHLFFDGGYGRVSSHLNRIGAAILSKKMAGILKNNRAD